MLAVKNQSYVTVLLFAILFLSTQLSLALNSALSTYRRADASESAEGNSFRQARVLDTTSITCNDLNCEATGSLKGQSYLQFQVQWAQYTAITINIDIGKPKYVLFLSLRTTSSSDIDTHFSTWPGDLSESEDGRSGWDKSLIIDSSAFSSRQLIIKMENGLSPLITSTLSITVQSKEDEDQSSWSISTNSWGSAVGGAVGAAVLIVVIIGICICVRRARLRRMARRQHSRAAAAYEVQRVENQPQIPPQMQQSQQQPLQFPPQYQVIQYQAPFEGQMQAPIMYQPINPNSPQYQFQPAIQLVQVPGQDYQYYQGYQFAPAMQPVQIVMPNPDEGPLSEMNFDHRFPEAPLENFPSSFPQKTCSICLEDLKANQNCRQLYCEHIFHGECAKVWLLNQMTKQNHGFCPNCNKNMTFVMESAKS